MFKSSIFAVSILFCFSSFVFAQDVHSPAKGSAERTAIMDALRAPVEKELKQKIIFSVDTFKVSGKWAFLNGEPQNFGGGMPDYKKTPYNEAIKADMFDNNIQALFKNIGGKWKVIKYAIGCTDVCYADCWRRYKAPKAIFPYTE